MKHISASLQLYDKLKALTPLGYGTITGKGRVFFNGLPVVPNIHLTDDQWVLFGADNQPMQCGGFEPHGEDT